MKAMKKAAKKSAMKKAAMKAMKKKSPTKKPAKKVSTTVRKVQTFRGKPIAYKNVRTYGGMYLGKPGYNLRFAHNWWVKKGLACSVDSRNRLKFGKGVVQAEGWHGGKIDCYY